MLPVQDHHILSLIWYQHLPPSCFVTFCLKRRSTLTLFLFKVCVVTAESLFVLYKTIFCNAGHITRKNNNVTEKIFYWSTAFLLFLFSLPVLSSRSMTQLPLVPWIPRSTLDIKESIPASMVTWLFPSARALLVRYIAMPVDTNSFHNQQHQGGFQACTLPRRLETCRSTQENLVGNLCDSWNRFVERNRVIDNSGCIIVVPLKVVTKQWPQLFSGFSKRGVDFVVVLSS